MTSAKDRVASSHGVYAGRTASLTEVGVTDQASGLVFAASVVFAALVVAACSGDGNSGDGSDGGVNGLGSDAAVSDGRNALDSTVLDSAPVDSGGASGVDASGVFLYDGLGNNQFESVTEDGQKRVIASTFGFDIDHPALVRVVLDGVIDPTFNGGQLDLGSPALGTHWTRVAGAADGHVYVALATAPGGSVGLLRLDESGHPDPTFGTSGVATANAAAVADASETPAFYIEGVAIQPDGKILVSGEPSAVAAAAPLEMFVVRFTSTGQVDPGFGTNGLWVGQYGNGVSSTVTSVAIGTNGSITIGGKAATSFADDAMAVARLTSDGKLDATFGGGTGFNVFQAADGFDLAPYVVHLSDDGSILGTAMISGPKDLDDTTPYNFAPVLIHWTAAGAIDTAFGNDAGAAGLLHIATGDPEPQISVQAACFDHQGRAIFAGSLTSADRTHYTGYVIRVLPNGVLDTSFGTNGHLLPTGAITPPKDSVWYAAFARSDDSLVFGGESDTAGLAGVTAALLFYP